MQTTINQRLKEYLEKNKITAPEFYHKIGATRIEYFVWIKQDTSIPLRVLLNILNLYPDINARWFLLGDGAMADADQYSGSGNIRIDGALSNDSKDKIELLKDHIASLKDNTLYLKSLLADKQLIIENLTRQLNSKNAT